MVDHEIRRLHRERDAGPADVGWTRRFAIALARAGDRAGAAHAWQDILRVAPRDTEAEQRLIELGCELLYRGPGETFESTVDGSLLERRTLTGGPLFVKATPVTYGEFLRFLGSFGPDARDLVEGWRVERLVDRKGFARWVLRDGTNASDPIHEVSFEGARAYAGWAGGRLLHPMELLALPLPSIRHGRELVYGGQVGRIRFNLVPEPHEELVFSHSSECFPGAPFRYLRRSWFRPQPV